MTFPITVGIVAFLAAACMVSLGIQIRKLEKRAARDKAWHEFYKKENQSLKNSIRTHKGNYTRIKELFDHQSGVRRTQNDKLKEWITRALRAENELAGLRNMIKNQKS